MRFALRQALRTAAGSVLLLPVLLGPNASSASAQVYIFGRVDFAAGNGPDAIATGDFNGDGKPDLAIANQSDNTVSILLGQPNGTFGPKTDVAVGKSPSGLAMADFNLDGKLDLAVTNAGDGTVSVLLGNGDGTFQSQAVYAVGKSPISVTAGAFNNANKNPDLAVVNNGDNTVSILIGNGDGTFASQVTYAGGNAPTSIIAGSFRNNGRLDLVVAGAGASILLGNGDGTFGAASSISTGAGPESLAAADIDQDGKLDLAVADATSSTVLTLIGNGDGTFYVASGITYAWQTGTGPLGVAITDLNGDGLPDLLTANSSGSVSVLIQNSFSVGGSSTLELNFASPANYAVTGALSSLVLGDFNGDGRIDAAVTNETRSVASVFISSGNGLLQIRTDDGNLGDPRATSLVAGDFNGDGRCDLMVPAIYYNGPPQTFLSNGDGTFNVVNATAFTQLNGPSATGDFNGDGKLDLAMPYLGLVGIAVLPGNGDGTFGTGVTVGSPSATGPILAGDFNNDGKLDLIYYDSSTVLVLGNGDGTFGSPATINPTLSPVLSGEFTSDGNLDLILQSSQGALSILLGNGNGTFGAPSTVVTASGPTVSGDFNGDGKLDLAILENGGVTVLLGNGDGTFQPGISTAAPGSLVGVGDFNNDGISDLALINAGTFEILYGNVDGTFRTDIVGSAPTNSLAGVAVGDMNGDGIPDLAVLTNDPLGEPDQTLSVLIGQAIVGLYPYSVTFPDTAVGSSSSMNVTVSDPAVGQLAISNIAVSSGFTQINDCPQTLASGSDCTISVSFAPTSAGTVTGMLTIIDNSPTNPHTIALTAAGGPEITLSPESYDFGNQLVGTSSAVQTITLTNTGLVPLTITSLVATGDFAETNNCGSMLAAGSSCIITVNFTPTTVGTQTGSITITDNGPGSPQIVVLSGTGVAPAPVVSLSPPSLSFGSQPVGTATPIKAVTLTNTGTAALTITGITASANYTAVSTCKSSIAVGAGCVINVTFKPSTAGTLAGTVTVADNAPNSPQTIALTGTGTSPAVALSPNALSFGPTIAGQSAVATAVLLTNTGAATLSVSSISIGGANAGDFSQQNNCGSTVTAGATCSINVTFKPTTGGTRTASLNVADNAAGSPQSVSLTGTGSDFTLTTASGSSNSATVTAGQSATYRLSVNGTGGLSGTVSLSCAGTPTAATCNVSPSSATLGLGLAPYPITITVTTTANAGIPLNRPPIGWLLMSIGVVLSVLAGSLAALRAALARQASRRARHVLRPCAVLSFAIALAFALTMLGCGGSSTSTTMQPTGTPSGTYKLTVTGTYSSGGANLQNGMTLTLTVQ